MLLWAVDCVVQAVFVTQPVSGMATGSGRPDADRPSQDVSILQRIQRAGVTLGSPELYNLDPEYVPDVLGLHARRPEAPVVKVMLGRDSQCIRVLILDDDVGFHTRASMMSCCLIERRTMRHMLR